MEFGEVPGDWGIFGVFGDDAEGFDRVEGILDFAFAAGCGKLVFEVFGESCWGATSGQEQLGTLLSIVNGSIPLIPNFPANEFAATGTKSAAAG